MEERISDYCNNCKKQLDLTCPGRSISCYKYDPIIAGSHRKNFNKS